MEQLSESDENATLEVINKSHELRQLQESMSLEDQIKVAAKILGYKRMPPDIATFIEDPYYLGNTYSNGRLFPFWKKRLKEIYPSPIHTAYTLVVLKGGIGTGKSTAAKIMALYTICRLDHLRDPFKSLGIAKGKDLSFVFMSATSGLADSEFIESIAKLREQSPYFKAGMISDVPISMVSDGPRSNNAISRDVLFYNLSELNFINEDIAWYKLDQSTKRFFSRFQTVSDYFGNIVVDSSSRGDDSITDKFIHENPFGRTKIITTNRWVVREYLNYYFKKGSFKVYAGDSVNPACIMEGANSVPLESYDRERIIECPMELYPDFKMNLNSALQDIAGISTKSSDVLYQTTTELKKCFKLPMYTEDIVTVDFYDKYDKLIFKLDRYINDIPRDKVIYIRYDLGVVKDYSGITIGYFDKYITHDYDKTVKRPTFKFPLSLAVSRLPGQETPILSLFEFVMDLAKTYEIGCFSADQFASRQLLQDIQREGINTRYISVDRTDEAYVLLKNLTNEGLVELPNNKLLMKELCELRRIGGKIDHPSTGSKDTADALSGCLLSIYQDMENATKISNKYQAKNVTSYYTGRLNEGKTRDIYTEMLMGGR